MPKENYYKLDDVKKNKIINAAYNEFLEHKHNYKKASVKRIAKNSGISIGSFYEYFHDKDDLFLYLIKKIILKKQDLILNENDSLKDNFLKFAKISENKAFLHDREIELLKILLYDNEDIKRKFYFDYGIDNFMQSNIDKLYKDKEKGLLRDDVDIEFVSYLFTTLEYNIIKYFEFKNISDKQEKNRIIENFIEMAFRSIYK